MHLFRIPIGVSHLGTLAGLTGAAVALGAGAHETFHGAPFRFTYLTALVAWIGYLVAHKAETGQFIHDPFEPSNDAPENDEMIRTITAGGFLLLVAGMVIGAIGIKAEQLIVSITGGVFFVGGYVIAHYGATGELL